MIHYSRGQTGELQKWLEKVKRHWGAHDTPARERAYRLRLQGLAHYLKGEYPESIECHQNSVNLLQAKSPIPNDISIAFTALANAQVQVRDYSAAKLNYENAGALAARTHDNEDVANSLSKLAALAVIANDWKKAEDLARKALPLAQEVHREALIACVSHYLGKALSQQGKRAEGVPYVRRAVDISGFRIPLKNPCFGGLCIAPGEHPSAGSTLEGRVEPEGVLVVAGSGNFEGQASQHTSGTWHQAYAFTRFLTCGEASTAEIVVRGEFFPLRPLAPDASEALAWDRTTQTAWEAGAAPFPPVASTR